MNQSDLQIVEDFNAQCEDISEKVDKLIKYLQECLTFEIDSEEKEVEVLKCAQLGIDNFDIYCLVDFIEEEQAQSLQNVVNEFYNKFHNNPKYSEFTEKLQYYLNTCETRLTYLSTVQRETDQNYYKLLMNNQVYPSQPETNQMDIEYVPQKLSKTVVSSKIFNQE